MFGSIILARSLAKQANFLKMDKICEIGIRHITASRLNTHHLDLGAGRCIAYQSIPGQRKPTIVMIPGLHSYTNMTGSKANCLLRYCDREDFPCVMYDHECSGLSPGDATKVLFTNWVQNALTVTEKLTDGPLVLVGSSLGGWLALITALQLKDRLLGLVLEAPALNYVWPYYHRNRALLPPQARRRLDEGDPHVYTHEFGDALLKQDFAADSRKYEMDLEQKLGITCPVRIIQGLNDTEIPISQSMKLCESLESDDVDLIYRKASGHQLESPPDLELLLITLDRLLKDNPVR
eukprot:TRINITY_DN4690_c0_g1_i10.p1 TRINITY_DN4690_c0_g1~~TRINITY_DN4690_c0_g1_i10.p1  ORF type:complete len:293 (-),score=50.21 TRINITY_DN4690_c0_g1_i10:619-1497(-)